MKTMILAAVAIMAVLGPGAPASARNNEPQGTNTHAHQGGAKEDPQPDHGKDNNCAGDGCGVIVG